MKKCHFTSNSGGSEGLSPSSKWVKWESICGSEPEEKLALPVMFIQHQRYLDRRMLQFWALRPSITDSSLTLSLELSVSSMASASFWKEHKRNPSESNGDTPTWDAHFSSTFSVHTHTMLTYTHGPSCDEEAMLGRGCNQNKGYSPWQRK